MQELKDYLLTQVAEKTLSAQQAHRFLTSLDQTSQQTCEYAVIGMACRFPGASTLEEYWDNFVNSRDLISSFPKHRAHDVIYVNQNTVSQFHGFQCRVGGYLDRIDLFDHSFFKLTPAEARVMDPSQRLFLHVAYEALEHAGLTTEALQGSATGVFVGYSVNEDNYINILQQDDPNIALGNQPSILAYRLSYMFDMRGPTMIIDTACSSSLVAVHQACQSIAAGDCDQAIVGGVNIRLFPAIREISNLGIEAYDGRCKTFDEKANGTNIGDGVGALVIKRKDLAQRDGDYIHAIIRGSAVNSDGNANGITAPNPEAQAALLESAWRKAGITPQEIGFIETHGTGTKLGDPVEVLGLTAAFAKATDEKHFCPLGAAKTNIGHLEAASGIAGLIKAVLCLQHRTLPANIHYHIPNPYIDFERSAVYPAAEERRFDDKNSLIAGVSSFGISGTNCHVVIEEHRNNESVDTHKAYPFLFSAKQEESLAALLTKYRKWLCSHKNVSLADLSYTLARGRTHYECRVAMMASSVEELDQKVEAYLNGKSRSSAQDEGDLVRLYLQKKEIFWDRYFPPNSGRKIPLPTYAFFERRHWPQLEVEETISMEERLRSVFYDLQWVETSPPSGVPYVDKKWFFFFMHPSEDHEAFASFLESRGISLVRVRQGGSFSAEGYECRIDPASSADYTQLVARAFQTMPGAFGGVIHLWDCLSPKDLSQFSWEEVASSQTTGAFSLFHLLRALKHQSVSTPWNLISLTTGAQKIVAEDSVIDPTRMPALGINKVASQEMPLVQSLAIDVDLTLSLFGTLYSEMFPVDTYRDAVVGYRQGKRYVQVLSQKNPFQAAAAASAAPIRPNGIYAIAGGAGYLGLETARLLATKASVTIVLIGRKPEASLSPRQQTKMEEIRKLGSQIIYLEGDVTLLASCTEVIRNIEQRCGALHGIFIAIKNISHKLLEEVSFEELGKNIVAKIQGTWLLDNLTKHLPLDFIATFSSISSLTGGPTGGDCCASNLFLDSFGEWRNAQHRRTLTMNFTLIEADDGSLLSDRMSMIPPLSREEFVACLWTCLSSNIPFAVMADFSSRVMSRVLPFMKIHFADDLVSKFLTTTPEQRPAIAAQGENIPTFEEIVSILVHIWKDVLGLDDVDSRSQYFEIGGESISAVKLLHLTKVQLQVQLEIADLYSYPVLEDLARFIEGKMRPQGSAHKEPSSDVARILEEFQSGKIDIAGVYEQIR